MSQPQLSYEQVAKGLKVINSILHENAQIKTKDSMDTYYIVLQRVPLPAFHKGIDTLINSWKDGNIRPTPRNILDIIEKGSETMVSFEDKILLSRADKLLHVKPVKKRS